MVFLCGQCAGAAAGPGGAGPHIAPRSAGGGLPAPYTEVEEPFLVGQRVVRRSNRCTPHFQNFPTFQSVSWALSPPPLQISTPGLDDSHWGSPF